MIRYQFDENTYGIDTQFLWGAALLILPVLNEVSKNLICYAYNVQSRSHVMYQLILTCHRPINAKNGF